MWIKIEEDIFYISNINVQFTIMSHANIGLEIDIHKYLFFIIDMVLFISCKEKVKEEKNTTEAKTEVQGIADANYNANTETSILNWKGFKPTGTHNGTINIENGVFKTRNSTYKLSNLEE